MTTRSPHECSSEALADALSRVVADPSRSELLYPIFGQFCHDFRNLLHSMHMSLYLGVELPPKRVPRPTFGMDWTSRTARRND